jgi:Fe-S oxidoreductase
MIIYFPGCTTNQRFPELRKRVERILRKMEVDYILFDEVCCGSILRNTGYREEFEENRKRFLEKFPEGDMIITGCPGCLSTFREEFPELPEVKHISEFLSEKLPEMKEIKLKVAYHDPCHLGRGLGIYDAPREVLRKCGVEFVEMERNRELSWCCGGGGGVRLAYPELSRKLSEIRMEEAKKAGASVLVTSCPFCLRNLNDVNSEVEVKDLIEIVEEALDDRK